MASAISCPDALSICSARCAWAEVSDRQAPDRSWPIWGSALATPLTTWATFLYDRPRSWTSKSEVALSHASICSREAVTGSLRGRWEVSRITTLRSANAAHSRPGLVLA
ncbi:hypothetical protein DMB42_09390 [Nonomuraea sp. WAC 01424]|nr:hypothetical protein DMB42_09390 [Nonomuraea sp. WAC 01424]